MERRAIVIRGTVQGVGFRPYVYGLASRFHIGGSVRNQTGGVMIEAEGETPALDQFIAQLLDKPPMLARIETWSSESQSLRGDREFRIEQSKRESIGGIVIAPDAATCPDCISELFDPRDRRYRYPFLNCTNCGQRLTIVTVAPYDRERTTMAAFAMCPACAAEYEDPGDRRFHAQPVACPACGPKLTAMDSQAGKIQSGDPLELFVVALKEGKIGAMKGLGGYHLVCDASNSAAVSELRRRKHRDEKPLAVMFRDLACAAAFVHIDLSEEKLLTSPRRPIVLLQKRPGGGLAAQIASGNPFLGVMLPYTPLNYLLLHDMNHAPLVMTSGNQSDEPIAYDEPDAIQRLSGIADIFLIHDRPIHVRCDDSVTRVVGGVESPIRRARGYAPQPIPLPISCPEPILAVGGQLKGAFALGNDRRTIVSHHLGDLDHFEASKAFERDIALYEQLFSIRPSSLVHDLHPDYASTRYAIRRASEQGINRLAVQHHHAHMASCMAEHGLTGPVIGVTLDGTGYGTDGAIWGGEFLVGDYCGFHRAAHLRYVGMPGGEQAVREPWRMAAAYLLDAETSCVGFDQRIPATKLRAARRMIERNFNTPSTSSAGRLFDAVASLIGVRDSVSYEGQAAMELEWLATTVSPCGAYPLEFLQEVEQDGDPGSLIIDCRPMIRAMVADMGAGMSPPTIARKFHETFVEMISAVCGRIRQSTGLNAVVFSGGVFMNALLSERASERLAQEGFRVHRHHIVPTNDGGLSLGQVAIAASQLTSA